MGLKLFSIGYINGWNGCYEVWQQWAEGPWKAWKQQLETANSDGCDYGHHLVSIRNVTDDVVCFEK